VPSKVLLVKPYPENLGIVPACFKCNNSFSNDELFLSILTEKLKIKHYGPQYTLSEETITRIKKNKKLDDDIERVNNPGQNEPVFRKVRAASPEFLSQPSGMRAIW